MASNTRRHRPCCRPPRNEQTTGELTMTDTTEHPTPKVPWSEVLKAENENWDWDDVIKQHAGQPSIERRYALRRYFGLWDDADPVANAILDLVEAQNELAQAISAEQYVGPSAGEARRSCGGSDARA
jgi:hypothetical protein